MSKKLQDSIITLMKLTSETYFEFKYLGYDCAIMYNDIYHNGYVGITKVHPFYGLHYDNIDIDVHGGLTYSEFGDDQCRKMLNDNGEQLYWIGFDCAHAGDFIEDPELDTFSYRKCNKSPQYIINEIFNMVHQLKNVMLKKE